MALLILVLMCVLHAAKPDEVNPADIKTGNVTFKTICRREVLRVEVTVDTDFKGKIYAKDKANECRFSPDADNPQLYDRGFLYSGTYCGQSLTTTANNNREASITIIVQFSPDVLMDSDKSYTATCTFDDETSVNTRLGSVNGSEPNLVQSEGVEERDVGTYISFVLKKVQDGSAEELDRFDEVPLGTQLQVVAELETNAIFNKLLMTNCVASNRADDSRNNYVSLTLLNGNGCLNSDNMEEIVSEPTYRSTNTGYEASLPLKAFIFTEGRTGDNNQLHVHCDILLCPPDNTEPCDYDAKCAGNMRKRRSADNDTDGRMVNKEVKGQAEVQGQAEVKGQAGVRRRRADDISLQLVRAERSVYVFSGSGGDKETEGETASTRPADDTKNCLSDPKVESIFAAFGVHLLALLVVVITLIVLNCRLRRRLRRLMDEAKETRDGHGRSSESSVWKLSTGRFA